MYRTDKAFMKDPATVSCRIYIGGLDESVTAESLEERFKAHGTILGLVLQRGFGFIQFDSESAVQQSIAKDHGQMFHGRKLNVKQALDGGKKTQNQAPPSNQTQEPENQPLQTSIHSDETMSPAQNIPPRRKPTRRGPKGNKMMPGRDRSPFDIPEKREFRDIPPYYGRDDSYGPGPVGGSNSGPGIYNVISNKSDRNDCEIIVVAKALTVYAEYIEQRLKKLGLIVDLLFPNEDVPIGRVLANISSRGCLYAILIMPQNEEHRSFTLNILHGIPEEHRNMPLEDALLLMTRNFDAYMRGEKAGPANGSGTLSLTDRHPEAIQVLINLLAENRQLTTLQYDRIIKYLHERRELQVKHEIGESPNVMTETEPNSKQAELQSRILNILNKSSSPGAMKGPPLVAQLSTPAPAATPLLNDPSVQKALDSLLQGDILRGISGSGDGFNY